MGVDYSINSPAICIFRDNRYFWLSQPKPEKSKKGLKIQEEVAELDEITLEFQPPVTDPENYSKNDVLKISRYNDVAENFLSQLQFALGPDNKKIEVGFEGYSFGSNSNNLIDIVSATTCFKVKFLSRISNEKDMRVFAPSTIKKHAGGGRLKKRELFDVFVENRLEDEILEKTDVWKFCQDLQLGQKVPKPLDDLIDAYFTVNCLRKIEA